MAYPGHDINMKVLLLLLSLFSLFCSSSLALARLQLPRWVSCLAEVLAVVVAVVMARVEGLDQALGEVPLAAPPAPPAGVPVAPPGLRWCRTPT